MEKIFGNKSCRQPKVTHRLFVFCNTIGSVINMCPNRCEKCGFFIFHETDSSTRNDTEDQSCLHQQDTLFSNLVFCSLNQATSTCQNMCEKLFFSFSLKIVGVKLVTVVN